MTLPLTFENVLTIAGMILAAIAICSWHAYAVGYADGKQDAVKPKNDSRLPFDWSA
jgi:hypothetical protein